MKILRQLLVLFVLFGAIVFATTSRADDERKDLVLKGDARCTACHDEADSPELLSIGKTKHGTAADKRTPTCTSCHGQSDRHVNNSEHTKDRPKPDRIFSGQLAPESIPAENRVENYFGVQGKVTSTPVDDRNGACLQCHKQDSRRSHWEGSTHQTHDVACTSCHKIHTGKDAVREKRTQADFCYACHKEQRAQNNKPSHHPIPEGKMSCSDCHNVHGSVGPKLMARDSVNSTCYTCHMEKRGPFVHSHEPVDDDCSNCHNPHGTTAESLLKTRAPFLCNSCHTPHGGGVVPSVAGPAGAPGVSFYNGSAINQGRACLNCHTEVHGSNNPGLTLPGSTLPNNAQFLLR